MLKSRTAQAGQRYSLPPQLQQRLIDQARSPRVRPAQPQSVRSVAGFAWAAAFAVLLLCATIVGLQYRAHRSAIRASEMAALVTEVSDQHIAALADTSQLQVLSSDRHTVKPWFQGKLPFSFNLPEGLPGDTTLAGADLTYLHGQPTAQLIYSIGKHRVSVFVRAGAAGSANGKIATEHAGFHIDGFTTGNLDVVAISDVDPARLADLVARIAQANAAKI
jgi:anti-sigma factor RsiW